MDKIISIRTNPFYIKTPVDNEPEGHEMKKHLELSFVVEKSKYEVNEKGDLVRLPNFSDFSFVIQADHFEQMIEGLKKVGEQE